MSRDRDIKSIQFQIKNLVTSIDELKLEIVDATDEGELTSLKNVSETHSKKVDTIEEKIISYDITDHAEFTTELATIRRNWRSNMREIAKRLNEIQKARESNNVDPKSINSANLNTLTRPKLPTLNLPTFDGNLGEYLSFWESFNTNIQSRTDLDKLDKFKYFQSLIKGKPLEFINGYTVSAANYDNMIEAFEKKFKKIDQLVYLYINNILNIYPIKKRNAQQLQQLVNVIRTSLNNLKSLDQKVEDWDAILNKIVLDKLDVDTLERWQMHHIDHQIPKFETLIEFLEKIADSQTTLQPQNIQISQVTFKQVNKQTCPCCRGDHPLFLCTNFQALDVHKRQQKVRAEKLCYNCLSKFHSLPTCQSKKTCKLCQKRHNTLLHIDNYANKFNNKQTSGKPTIENSSNHQSSNKVEATQTTIQSSVTHSNNLSVILPTVLISILDDNQLITARALIDTGSQSTCISESLAQKMTNTRHAITVQISGIVANSTSIIKQAIAIKFCPIKDPAICFDTEALILPKLHSPFPDVSFSTQDDAFIRKLSLADPTFNQALPIDVLIGGKLACDILIGGQRLDSPDRSLSAVNTLFGWVIMGNYHPNQHFPGTIYSYLTVRNPPSDLIGKLWELEDIPISNKVLSPQDKLSEKILSESLTTLTSGRFSVDLIFENYPPKLGESLSGAAKRFSLLEKRFQKNPDFKLQYTKAFQEYMVLGQMEAITNLSFDIPHYYIPHHPVLKTSSLTTKLRIVFDGSFLSSNGKSLNQNLFTGPTLQQDIRHLLMGFRLYKYVISADLQQMYRQILINSHHRDFLRVLWRNDEKEPLRHYRLTTVPFGLTCSPFSAIRVLHHVADQNEQMYPHAAKVIRQNFYVDDLLVGANSEEELFKLIKEVVIILEQAKFKFDKWASNSPELLKSLRDIGLSTDSHASRTLISSANTLGIQWNIQQDQFQFPIEFQIKTSLTKRILLSSLAKIYDPLGFLSPFVLLLKIMMQKAWLLKLSWDTKLPEEHQNLWLEMVDNFPLLQRFSIPRLARDIEASSYEIHAFSDASEVGYGTCAYLLSYQDQQIVSSQLLFAKSKVAPIHFVSIPRLELCSCHLMAKTYSFFKPALHLRISKVIFYSDSKIALSWIHSKNYKFQTFVANRVHEIQTLCPEAIWQYIPSEDNPADIVSRGLTVTSLLNNYQWLHGPFDNPSYMLNKKGDINPRDNILMTSEEEIFKKEVKIKPTSTILITSILAENLLSKYSSLTKLKRVLSYMLRFAHNAQPKKTKIHGPITLVEYDKAMIQAIRLNQLMWYSEEYHKLEKSQSIKSTSSLVSLNPFFDQADRIIRVGGRLKHSLLSYSAKHPIVISNKGNLAILIVRYFHNKLNHGDFSILSAHIRSQYWIIKLRHLIRVITHQCPTCRLFKTKRYEQLMSDLPTQRVVPSRPLLIDKPPSKNE